MEVPVELLIVDNHEFIRRGLIRILANSHPEWRVVADALARNGSRRTLSGASPRCGYSRPLHAGHRRVAGRRAVAGTVPGIRIIILSMYSAAPILRHLRKVGISAYLAKNEAPKMLVHAVKRVLAGEPFFLPPPALPTNRGSAEYIPVQFLLTPRELDVLHLLARGKSNKDLAADLDMSVRTAESHHANIMAKLNVTSLGQLLRIAFRDGVI